MSVLKSGRYRCITVWYVQSMEHQSLSSVRVIVLRFWRALGESGTQLSNQNPARGVINCQDYYRGFLQSVDNCFAFSGFWSTRKSRRWIPSTLHAELCFSLQLKPKMYVCMCVMTVCAAAQKTLTSLGISSSVCTVHGSESFMTSMDDSVLHFVATQFT